MTKPLHVIFGAGQIGTLLAERLRYANATVRVVRRSSGAVAEGVEVVSGDATNRNFCVQASEGATAVYHCMNPAYSSRLWARVVPRLMENLIAAASSTSARLVVLDNLYMYGRPSGTIDEHTPFEPVSRKGEIRADASHTLLSAMSKGDVGAAIARASDFFGPGGLSTHFGDRFWKAALAGKTAQTIFDPDTPHSYNYIPDVAEGLAAIGLSEDDVLGRTWMLPACLSGPTRDLVRHFSKALGREIQVARMPGLLVKALGLVMPIVREVDEMTYQWDVPFLVDDRPFRKRFAFEPTPPDRAARATVEWAQEAFG